MQYLAASSRKGVSEGEKERERHGETDHIRPQLAARTDGRMNELAASGGQQLARLSLSLSLFISVSRALPVSFSLLSSSSSLSLPPFSSFFLFLSPCLRFLLLLYHNERLRVRVGVVRQ